jgi:hypothetical protein
MAQCACPFDTHSYSFYIHSEPGLFLLGYGGFRRPVFLTHHTQQISAQKLASLAFLRVTGMGDTSFTHRSVLLCLDSYLVSYQ